MFHKSGVSLPGYKSFLFSISIVPEPLAGSDLDSFFGSVAGRKKENRGFLSQVFIHNFNGTKFTTIIVTTKFNSRAHFVELLC